MSAKKQFTANDFITKRHLDALIHEEFELGNETVNAVDIAMKLMPNLLHYVSASMIDDRNLLPVQIDGTYGQTYAKKEHGKQ